MDKEYFPPNKNAGNDVNVNLDLNSYVTKEDLKDLGKDLLDYLNLSNFAAKDNFVVLGKNLLEYLDKTYHSKRY